MTDQRDDCDNALANHSWWLLAAVVVWVAIIVVGCLVYGAVERALRG